MISINSGFSREDIQAALDAGGEIVFEPGLYENAHFRLAKPVHITGYGAVLAAGEKIKWRTEGGLLVCCAPKDIPVRVLCVNGELRQRCRLPETGYFTHESVFDVKWMSTTGGGWQRTPTEEELTTLKVKLSDIAGLTLSGAEVTVVHSWDESLVTVKSVKDDIISFKSPCGYPAGSFNVHDYCLWNVKEAFVKAGTFYHDVAAGLLYYRPLPGESEETEAFLPAFDSVFYSDAPLNDIEIEGFTLTACDTPRVSAGFGAFRMTGAIDLADIENCRLHHLKITASGGYGIRTTGKVKGLRIASCDISMMGAGGVRAGERFGSEETKSVIEDLRVRGVGFYYASAIGIAATDCHIRHNEVCHTSYSAINCGGSDYRVEKNLIHDCMEVLNDGAAIYSFGTKRGVMKENLVYGIHPVSGHTTRVAYYLDETCEGWRVINNVALDCDFPNHNHMCGGHVYTGNIFVNDGGLMIKMQKPASPNIYEGNVLSAGGSIVFVMPENAVERLSGNFIHSADGTLKRREPDSDIIDTLPFDASNTLTERITFTKETRVFSACGLTIDLTDVGPGTKEIF